MLTPPPLASFALAACSVMNDHLAVTSTTADCILDGSHHVTDLNLNDRYNLDVRIVMNWKNERLMSSEGILMVEVGAGPDERAAGGAIVCVLRETCFHAIYSPELLPG